MESSVGRIIEVFIPEEGNSIFESNKIGFRVAVEDKIITIVQEQNNENICILREDKVMLTKEIIEGKEIYHISQM